MRLIDFLGEEEKRKYKRYTKEEKLEIAVQKYREEVREAARVRSELAKLRIYVLDHPSPTSKEDLKQKKRRYFRIKGNIDELRAEILELDPYFFGD